MAHNHLTTILMAFDNRCPWGAETERLNQQYAQVRGYDFIVHHELPYPELHPYFNKVALISRYLSSCKTIWWLDADAFFLRQDQDLPVFTSSFALSSDWGGLSCGVQAFRNNPFCRDLLQAWLFLGEVDPARINDFHTGGRQFYDQTSLKLLIHFYPRVAKECSVIAESIVQCYSSRFDKEGLILHTWSGIGPERIAQTIKNFEANGYTRDTLVRPPDWVPPAQ